MIDMDIIGSVAPTEVPAGRGRTPREGVWTGLARRAVADHEQERVTVISLADNDELKKMRNGVAFPLRNHGYALRPVVVESDSELRVFMELKPAGPGSIDPAMQTNGAAR
jgi:hypothetical protein